ncbi:MAG TPA: histidine kinase [Bacteroidota bacterium]|nr:histidine kinase [Bacteroidota bacterium]
MKRDELLRTFIFCLIITFVIAAGFIYSQPHFWKEALYSSFVFSMCIGFSIHTIMYFFSARLSRLMRPVRYFLQLVTFLAGGLIGTEVGIGILIVTVGYKFAWHDEVRLLSMNFVLSALFGTLAVVYFTLRARVERMAAALKEKELNEERLNRTRMEAELKALQARINPHFLFNTLNSIASLISENPKSAEATVEKLSDIFRYTLKSADRDTVTLAEELDIIRIYLEIEKVRFGDRLRYEITCEEPLRDLTIPALIIQPLVENSIKHGLASQVRGGTVRVEVGQKDGHCLISVIDDGKGLDGGLTEGGFGLKSIEERLRLRYGDAASLRIIPDRGAHFQITIPAA